MQKALLSIFILIFFLFSGCSGNEVEKPETTPAVETKTKNELITCYLTSGENLNPLYADTENDISVFSLIYDSLIYLDSNMNIVPQLAESCTVSGDCKSIDFVLRRDILWHDGTPFTAKDVKFTFETIKAEEPVSTYYDNLTAISDIKVKDDFNFTLKLSGSYARIVNLLDFPIIPSHIKDLSKNPIGTGRYKYESGDNKEIILAKNTLWKLSDLPAQQNIKIKKLGKSTDQFTLFKTGELDMMTVNLHQLGVLGVSSKLKYEPYITPKYEFIGFNFSNPVLADTAVRKAVSAALNREEIIKDSYLGFGSATNAPILPTSYFYNSDVDDIRYSPEQAGKILSDGGWKDSDGDGILDKNIDGETYSLKASLLVNSDNNFRISAAKKISAMLTANGMSVTVKEVSWENYQEKLFNDDFSMFLGGIEFAPSFDYSFLLSKWAIENAQNFMNYSSADMDKTISKTLSAISMDECKNAYLEFQYIFSRDIPVVGIAFQHNCIIYQDGIEGVKEACFSKPLINFNTWHRK